MTFCSRAGSGQAMAEFCLFSTVSVVIVGMVAFLMKHEWDRMECAYVTFERTHLFRFEARSRAHTQDENSRNFPRFSESRLKRGFRRRSGVSVRVWQEGDWAMGEGICGKHRENVRLPLLENARW